ncbi:hypothetical protein K7I13_01370 [Brucepastera parasyntrophica]|uniref:ABC transporter permease n=1 Tax=Brucepastera parasyntrophica TaxID=2880008 RepID=UPI00210DC7F0|nr:hypothetical protein [Brucepastera parasyntrophica]ULQ60013.1 hypothetical protein K7I13_01370 [Brucepastera parasyntrophica]
MKKSLYQFTVLLTKELKQVFSSLVFSLASLFFLLGTGIPFFYFRRFQFVSDFALKEYFASFPLLSVLIFPALTMNIWADERKKETELILFALPVNDWLLVAGKFSAQLLTYLFLLLMTVPVVIFLPFQEAGTVFTTYTALFLAGFLCLSLGQFFSALFSFPAISFICSAAVLLLFNTIHLLPQLISMPGSAAALCTWFSFAWHFETASRGILDSRDLVFFIIPALMLLYANTIFLRYRRCRR